ncbi:MAG: hypothetical protein KF901_04065 [Myxococcales bacterium]|nr:hypothetical protein [Myxococcales bacterium]
MQPLWTFPAMLPRHAFSPRDVARAGDVWRAFQEAAVEGSTRAGWPPPRYREVGSAFVMREMTVRHHHETFYGEPLEAKTWVRRFRREMLSTREVRLSSGRGPVASATQEWVHVSEALAPSRAPRALTEAFPVHDDPADESPALPPVEPEVEPGPTHAFTFEAWFAGMDPLDHVNHPAYVDFCDEAIARRMHAAGLAPASLVPVAEWVKYLRGVRALDRVEVRTRRVGRTSSGDVAFGHEILVGETLCAQATTVRRLAEAPADRLAAAL